MTPIGEESGGAGRRRQWTPFGIVTAVLIPLVGIVVSIVFGVLTLQPGGDESAASATSGAPPPTSQRIDDCLLGLWLLTGQDPTSIDLDGGEIVKPVTVTGGVTFRFGADSRGAIQFAMDVTGKRGDDVAVSRRFSGVDSFTYTADGYTISYTHGSDDATVVTTVGDKVHTEAAPANYLSFAYSCTPQMLRLGLGGKDGTATLTRVRA